METNQEIGIDRSVPSLGVIFEEGDSIPTPEAAIDSVAVESNQIIKKEIDPIQPDVLVYPDFELTPEELAKFTITEPKRPLFSLKRKSKRADKAIELALDEHLGQYDEIPARIVYHLCSSGKAHLTVPYLNKFKDVDQSLVARQLLLDGKQAVFFDNFRKFKNLDTHVARSLIDAGESQLVGYWLGKFNDLSSDIAFELARGYYPGDVLGSLETFVDLNVNDLVDEIIRFGDGSSVADCIDQLSALDHNEIAEKLLQANCGYALSENLGSFEINDRLAMVSRLIEEGYADIIAMNVDTYKADESPAIFQMMLEAGCGDEAIRHISHFRHISADSVRYLLDREDFGGVFWALSACKDFPLYELIDRLIMNQKSSTIALLPATYRKQQFDASVLDKYVASGAIGISEYQSILVTFRNCINLPAFAVAAQDLFGEYCSAEGYKLCHAIYHGEPHDLRALLNIETSGAAGIGQLKGHIHELKTSFIQPDDKALRLLYQSREIRSLFREFVRFDEAQYADNRKDEMLCNYVELQLTHPRAAVLPEGYEPSDMYAISYFESSEDSESLFTEDVESRYYRLLNILDTAIEQVGTYKLGTIPFESELNIIKGRIVQRIDAMQSAHQNLLVSGKDEQAIHLAGQIEALQSLYDSGLHSFEDLETKFDILARDSSIADALMTILTARALRFDPNISPEMRRERFKTIERIVDDLPDEPTIKGLSKMSELVNETILKNVYIPEFKNNATRVMIRDLFSVKALELAVDQLQNNNPHKSSAQIQFVPSKGVLLELSGHIADACWAEKYERIADEFPNITAVIMARHYKKGLPRLVGAMLLIETVEEQTGDPYVVIRGLNPIMNFINKVETDDFMDAVYDYTKKIAAARGRKLAITIDESHTAAGTNRPSIHEYTFARRNHMPQVIVPENDTTFNDYEITDKVYAVE